MNEKTKNRFRFIGILILIMYAVMCFKIIVITNAQPKKYLMEKQK